MDNNEKKENMNPSIKFRKKKMKSNIRLGAKAVCIIFLAGLSGAIFSNIIIESKYNSIIKNNISNKINEDMVIIDYTKIAQNVSQSLVGISDSEDMLEFNSTYNSQVTGILIAENGIILTAYSGIKDINNIYVKLPMAGVKPIKGELIVADEAMDIALVKVSYDDTLEVIKLAKSEETKIGQGIAIISNPTGDGYVKNIVPGIITSTDNIIGDKSYKLMQVSAPINELNNGGAICNSSGELIGIASYKITKEKDEDRLYYAIDLKELEDLIGTATKFKDILGLVGGSIVKEQDSDIQGFYVQGVKKGGLADKAGIGPTDIITEVDGNKITSSHDIQMIIKEKKSGDEIKLKVVNAGNVREIKINL